MILNFRMHSPGKQSTRSSLSRIKTVCNSVSFEQYSIVECLEVMTANVAWDILERLMITVYVY